MPPVHADRIANCADPNQIAPRVCTVFIGLPFQSVRNYGSCIKFADIMLKDIFLCCQCKGAPLPVLKVHDPVERDVEFVPTKTPYDPRWMLAGRPNPGTLI